MLVTKAETDALFEGMRSVLGDERGQWLFLEMWEKVSHRPEAELPPELEDEEMIGEAHGAPTRPRSVEP